MIVHVYQKTLKKHAMQYAIGQAAAVSIGIHAVCPHLYYFKMLFIILPQMKKVPSRTTLRMNTNNPSIAQAKMEELRRKISHPIVLMRFTMLIYPPLLEDPISF